jgi:MOSC domain-containing protein YiiM
MSATVAGIYIAHVRKEKMISLAEVRAVPGSGLEGDRYARQAGTFTKKKSPTNQVTLIEAEAVEAFTREAAVAFSAADSRRNIVTRGIRLNDLVGREFCLGEVRLRGLKLCPPCTHLAGLTTRAVLSGLKDRGGLRAQILNEGVIRVGDPIHQLAPEEAGTSAALAACAKQVSA